MTQAHFTPSCSTSHPPRGSRGLRLALAVALSAALGASEWTVASNGSDANDGRSSTTPFRTIGRAATAVNPGDTVRIRGGTYRESVSIARSGTAAAPITFVAWPGETPVIKGSQVVAGWTVHAGAVWKKPWSVNSQQVFVDGAPLQQVGVPSTFYAASVSDGSTPYTPVGAGLADVTAGRFWFDAVARTLYVRLVDSGDPNAHLIEASTAQRLLGISGTNVQVRGLAFRHSATAAYQYGGAAVELGSDCLLERCDVQWCDAAGISPGYQKSRARIIDCIASNNGNLGIGTANAADFLIRGCTLERNNYRRFHTEWQAGGAKITGDSWGTIERCVVRDNIGMGIWFDYCNSGGRSIARDNWISGCVVNGEGIIVECSRNVLVCNNIATGNERRGIYVSGSSDVTVANNTVVGNHGWAALEVGGMPRAGRTVTGIAVHNNLVVANDGRFDVIIVKENGGDVGVTAFDYNCLWRATGTLALRYAADSRQGYAGTTYASVATWRAATAFSDHCQQAWPRFRDAAAGDYTLLDDSPARDAGLGIAAVASDRAGLARPQGGAWDLGAYEIPDAPPVILAISVPAPVGSGTTSTVAVTASDDGGAPLNYAWSVAQGDADAVVFADPSAATSLVTFRHAGSFVFAVRVGDAQGNAVSRTLPVTVAPSASALVVAPAVATVAVAGRRSFACAVRDQFGDDLSGQPAAIWENDGGGTIGSDGVFLAGATAGGPYAVRARLGGLSQTAWITVTATFRARVDFQPVEAPVMGEGWLPDCGMPFGDRGNGLVYGWNAQLTQLRDRNDAASPHQRYDTLAFMQRAPNADASWEIAVPDGEYLVRIVCGDPLHTGLVMRVAVEGVVAVDGTTDAQTRWLDATRTVSVSDGRLTLSNAVGARANRICFVEIIAAAAANG